MTGHFCTQTCSHEEELTQMGCYVLWCWACKDDAHAVGLSLSCRNMLRASLWLKSSLHLKHLVETEIKQLISGLAETTRTLSLVVLRRRQRWPRENMNPSRGRVSKHLNRIQQSDVNWKYMNFLNVTLSKRHAHLSFFSYSKVDYWTNW